MDNHAAGANLRSGEPSLPVMQQSTDKAATCEDAQYISPLQFERLRHELCAAVREEITSCLNAQLSNQHCPQDYDTTPGSPRSPRSPPFCARRFSRLSFGQGLRPAHAKFDADQASVDSGAESVLPVTPLPPVRTDSVVSGAIGGPPVCDHKHSREGQESPKANADQAPCKAKRRAHMIGARPHRKVRDRNFPPSGATVYELEQQLASELFQARELVPPKPPPAKKDPVFRSRSCASLGNSTFNWSSPKEIARQLCDSFVATDERPKYFRSESKASKVRKNSVCDSEAPPSKDESRPAMTSLIPLDLAPVGSIPSIARGVRDPCSTESFTGVADEPARQVSSTLSINRGGPDSPLRMQHGRVPTFTEMKRMQDDEFTKSIDLSSGDVLVKEESKDEQSLCCKVLCSAGIAFCHGICKAVGIVPWSEHWHVASGLYQWLIFGLAMLNTCVSFQQAFGERSHDVLNNGEDMDLGPFLNAVLSMGAALGLLSCGCLWRSQKLTEATRLVRVHCHQVGIQIDNEDLPSRDLACICLTWVCAMMAMAHISQHREDQWTVASVRGASLAFSSAVLIGICHYVILACRRLTRMIDHFCFNTLTEADFHAALGEWNVLQALCRKSCSSVQIAFLALQVTATALVLLSLNQIRAKEFTRFMVSVPGLPTVMLVFRTSVWAAAVTDKCLRVPMLVNCVTAGNDIDQDRLYVVQYIKESQAGFYLFEFRLTSATVLKMAYVACAGCFFLTTRIL